MRPTARNEESMRRWRITKRKGGFQEGAGARASYLTVNVRTANFFPKECQEFARFLQDTIVRFVWGKIGRAVGWAWWIDMLGFCLLEQTRLISDRPFRDE